MAAHADFIPDRIKPSRLQQRGKFGRMFPYLPPCQKNTDSAKDDLIRIAGLIFESEYSNNNQCIPAGYTYFGQFCLHDITFDPTTIGQHRIEPKFLQNFRTPAFDLDSLYGNGPFVSPYFFEHDSVTGKIKDYFLVVKESAESRHILYDVPRMCTPKATAIIADPRNDDNLFVSQIHAAFLVFHNKIVDKLKGGACAEYYQCNPEKLFSDARQQVKWYYQWVVLYDYLPRIIDLSEHKDIKIKIGADCENEKKTILARMQIESLVRKASCWKFFRWRTKPFIPLELSAAAFRFGHSQIRTDYAVNLEIKGGPFRDNNVKSISKKPYARVHFPLFFPDPNTPTANFNPSKVIGPHIAGIMYDMPDTPHPANIASRNLLSGLHHGLPSGQRMARAMGLKPIAIGKDIPLISKSTDNKGFSLLDEQVKKSVENFPDHLRNNTPAWYYILYEAHNRQNGSRLGPLASRIIADAFIALIHGDPESFLRKNPKWVPLDKDGQCKPDFSMADLLRLAGIYYPITAPPTVNPPPLCTP